MRIYLAHPISTTGEFNDSIRVAENMEKEGFTVYAAARNNSINDKSNDPTPMDIYDGDVTEIAKSDIFVVNLTGGLQDGTISEVGIVAGMNIVKKALEPLLKRKFARRLLKLAGISPKPIKIIAYTSNARLLQPQHYLGIPSAGANHLVLGIIERWGSFVGNEKNMLQKLKELKEVK